MLTIEEIQKATTMSETREQQIKRLKTNEKPHVIFADMPKEDQTFLCGVPTDFLEVLGAAGGILIWSPNIGAIHANMTYRIRSDYHEEPQIKPYEVFARDRWMYVSIEGTEYRIQALTGMAGFEGFWLQGIFVGGGPPEVEPQWVARKMDEGCKVVARIRR